MLLNIFVPGPILTCLQARPCFGQVKLCFEISGRFLSQDKTYNREYTSVYRVAKVEVVSGVKFMRVGREIVAGKREV